MRVRLTFTSNLIGNVWKHHVYHGKHGKLYLNWWLYSTLLLRIPGFWLESTRPWWQAGPRVSHRGLCAHSALSSPACLFWLGCCNLTRGASVHGRYVSLSLCSRAVGLKKGRKTRRRSPGCFPSVAFQKHSAARSLLAPNAPGPFSKAKRWNPRSQKRSKTISPSEWANFHNTLGGKKTEIGYVQNTS